MKSKDREPVITSTSIKQLYRYRYGKYVLGDDVDSTYELYKINCHLLPLKKVNTLKEDLGKSYERIMELHEKFVPAYEKIRQYRKILAESKDQKEKDYWKAQIDSGCAMLQQINKATIIIFTSLVLNTDLAKLPVLSPQISNRQKPVEELMLSEESFEG